MTVRLPPFLEDFPQDSNEMKVALRTVIDGESGTGEVIGFVGFNASVRAKSSGWLEVWPVAEAERVEAVKPWWVLVSCIVIAREVPASAGRYVEDR